LLEGDNYLTAALARDPITLNMELSDVVIDNNNSYNVAVRNIDDIVITETGYGKLRKGDELWVYVTGARANEVEFATDFVAEVNTEDSGLKLTRGSVLRHRWSNSWVNGVRFTVEEVSRERASRSNSTYGEIVITGGAITGPVYPGVEYEVVVSGSAVAANNYTVFENRRESSQIASYDESRIRSWRLFDSEPYSTAAFEYDMNSSEAPPVEVEVLVPPIVRHRSLTLNEWTPAGADGIVPFIMHQINESTKVGMVSPRVIAEFFDGNVQWDGTTATITADHKDGGSVTVTLQAGATSGTVNGATQDIATFSSYDLSKVPAGSVEVVNVDGRFYVPMRFVTNAFGYSIEWNSVTNSVTITN